MRPLGCSRGFSVISPYDEILWLNFGLPHSA